MHAGKWSDMCDNAIESGRLCRHISAAGLLTDTEELAVSKRVSCVIYHFSMVSAALEYLPRYFYPFSPLIFQSVNLSRRWAKPFHCYTYHSMRVCKSLPMAHDHHETQTELSVDSLIYAASESEHCT